MIAVANADQTLVMRCQANDLTAFNEIVDRYKNRVYNYVCRMVGPGSDAEDLTQETFIKAYTNIRSFQSRAGLNTWLYRIATNLSIDFLRRTSRSKGLTSSLTRENDEGGEDTERDFPDMRYEPESVLMNSELGGMLNLALSSLPDKLRAVVLLYDIEGLQYDEIARIVDCPLGTVKSRLFNARAALREKLAPYLTDVSTVQPRESRNRI